MRYDTDILIITKKERIFYENDFLWAIFGVVMISCNSSQKNNAPIKNREIKTESQAHTSNLFGTYEGTLPAADCEGIKRY